MRRFALRDLHRNDDGLSLVEVVVSLVVFGLISSALATGIVVLTHVGYSSRIRQLATTLAQQTIETNRAVGVGNLAICSASSPPATYNGSQAAYSGMAVVTSSVTGCLPYTSTTTSHGVNFSITNWVVQTGTATSVAGFTQYEKALIVTVAWTTPSPGGSYTANTLVQNGTNTQSAGSTVNPTVLTINAQYNDTSTGWTNINDAQQDGNFFDVTVNDASGNTIVSGTTGEGTWSTSSSLLTPGTNYTCIVSEESGLYAAWQPNATQPTGETVSADNHSVTWSTCTVASQQTTTYSTYWTAQTGSGTTASTCAVNTKPGGGTNLWIVVKDANGGVPSGAVNVAIDDGSSSEPAPPGQKPIDATQTAKFGMSFAGPVYITANPGGDPPTYFSSGQIGPICVQAGATTTYTLSNTGDSPGLTLSPTPVSGANDSAVAVTVTNADNEAIKTYQVTITNGTNTATGTNTVPSTQTVGSAYDQGTLTMVVPNGTGYSVSVCVVQPDGGCNLLQSWSGQTFNHAGAGPPKNTYVFPVNDTVGGSA